MSLMIKKFHFVDLCYLHYQVCKYKTGICLQMTLTVNVVPVKWLYLGHFLVLTSEKDFHVTVRQVSYKNIVCNSFEHIQFDVWKPRNADIIDFLFPFQENCFRIPSNASANGDNALSKSQCFDWFKKFKSVDFDFIKKRGRPPKSFKTAICWHCLMNMTLKRNNLRNN